ncbi:ABC transporter ATP-binding protein [Solicola sp. PLA-1-18]|uniref:ABC transporter ATP-binding protein n=1 Tax=Solicola sp. PLA-1-18 TaxID=3380532 RepID=UPI003B7C6D8B
MTSAVHLDHVTRRFGDVLALDDVSLDVAPGELVGVLGPNGAGKSTMLSLVTGQRAPSSGTVRVFDGDPRQASTRVHLGVTPQDTGLPPTLRVAEVVAFVGGHYPDPFATDELLERFDLADLARRQCGGLSGGQQRRLAVALSMVGRPRLVLLDEPTTGLDVDARTALWAAVRGYCADGGTVVLTSHYLEEVQQLAERVVVVAEGRVLVDDTVDAVIAHVDVDRVTMHSPDRAVGDLAGVTDCHWTGDRVEVLTPDADAFVRSLVASGVEFSHLRVQGASLEDAFTQLTRHQSAAPAEEAHA